MDDEYAAETPDAGALPNLTYRDHYGLGKVRVEDESRALVTGVGMSRTRDVSTGNPRGCFCAARTFSYLIVCGAAESIALGAF